MTPAPRSSSVSRHDMGVAVQSKPTPADPRDGSVAGDTDSRRQLLDIEESLLPLKKRTMSGSCSGGATDDSFVIPPKKKRVVHTGITLQTHRYDTPKPSNSSNAITTSKQTLQQKKLMHGAIGSGGVGCHFSHALAARNGIMEAAETSVAGPARAKKKTNRNGNRNKRPRQTARENVPLVHKTLPPLGTELSDRLQMLGATATDTSPPRFVCKKTLHKSDVDKNQNRLLFSCKPEVLARHPITALYAGNEKEAYFVHECTLGLAVTAFDGHGRKFDIRLRYLSSNGGFRFIAAWNTFVKENGLGQALKKGRRVDVEVWAFRSKKLPVQPRLKDKDKQQLVEGLKDHPDGALGVLFLPYVHSAAVEERPPVHETKRQASGKVVPEEQKIEHDHVLRENRGKAAVERQMTFDEVVAAVGPEEAESLVGFLMLRSACCSPVSMLNHTHIYE